ncbi:hypothetical protein SASPL_140813 [Salvia splendens]|uniref:Beta-1,3-glucosyltransferase n=1 Tax=Salvia splendens TaxID=180675 RepID=A0A8X8WQN3_SALSN|nr:hypothetical protein SASPL_140813 [Salvia splendens]
MKAANSETLLRDSMRKDFPKLMLWLILLVTATFLVFTTKLLSSPHDSCDDQIFATGNLPVVRAANETTLPVQKPSESLQFVSSRAERQNQTGLEHIVFGIAASANFWGKRKEYIKLWWNPQLGMRGIVWLDRRVRAYKNETERLPPLRVSSDTSQFAYRNKRGHRSAIRISRIVSETLRSVEMGDVRWLVMGDDDTVFVAENLVRVLRKYDHNQYYYIGSSSESHLQNIHFSYAMAYGGGGFAISYPLAVALQKMQDRCIQRYPGLYGSDDRMQACMAELGVPLTKELGFHQVSWDRFYFLPPFLLYDVFFSCCAVSFFTQGTMPHINWLIINFESYVTLTVYSWWMEIQYDVHGDLFGLLAAHPVTPLVSLHHLDVVEPIFPNVTRIQALQRLRMPMQLDSAALMQQSICYDKTNSWTISVSWGFAVQVFRGVLSPREIEMPSRTFLNWYKRADYTAYAFNTRPVMRNPCQKPFVFYLSRARLESSTDQTVSIYTQHHAPQPECKWNMTDPNGIDRVEVHKKPDPHLWDRSPRRNCCRVLRLAKKSLVIDVGVCREGEITEV